jgi:hypothetical protein
MVGDTEGYGPIAQSMAHLHQSYRLHCVASQKFRQSAPPAIYNKLIQNSASNAEISFPHKPSVIEKTAAVRTTVPLVHGLSLIN